MEFIFENLKTKIKDSCDVLVAGGGFAGIAAALAAARNGAKTILVENQFILGGLGTAGIVTIYLPLCDGAGNQVSFGIAEELLRLSVKMGWEDTYPDLWMKDCSSEERKKGPRFETGFNPHLFAINSEQLLLGAGVKILYGTRVCSVAKEAKKISSVIVENKSGRYAIKVKSVVDSTGDADVCAMAGAKTDTFKQGNLLAAWYYAIKDNKPLRVPLGECDTPDEYKTAQTDPDLAARGRFLGLDGEELTELVCRSHSFMMDDIINKKKLNPEYVPVNMPSIPQVRMTRKLVGTTVLDDKADHENFSDSIGLFGNWRKRGPAFALPFGSLYGNEIENLITAGRCISTTESMWELTRVIPVCCVSGEAAGTAAAISDNFAVLDIAKLQNILKKSGVKLFF
ncbi:MAG: FAD-dependent oxidoreductase [Bacillota bacterium]|nr:FAD-dependent oxidoreductase [Bacillota bacterium]